jgi:hypothetical protein
MKMKAKKRHPRNENVSVALHPTVYSSPKKRHLEDG